MTRLLATWGVAMLVSGCGSRQSAPREKEQFSLTVRSEGRGGGHVRSTPLGLDCELRPSGEDDAPSCELKVPEGSQLMLTASANETSYFKGWADNCGGRGYCLVTVDKPRVVGVNFERTGGEVRWPLSFGGKSTNVAWAAATTANNEVVVAGSFEGTTMFGHDELISAGGSDIFVAKYDKYGMVLWAVSFGGPADDRGIAVAVNKAGTILVTGQMREKVKFGDQELTAGYSTAGFVLALGGDGPRPNVLWADKLAGSSAVSGFGIQTFEDDAYVVGTFGRTLVVGHTFTSQGGNDAYFVRYKDVSKAEAHKPEWAKTLGGDGNDNGRGVAVDASGDPIVVGEFSRTPEFCEGAVTSKRAPPPPPPPVSAAGKAPKLAKGKGKGPKPPDAPPKVTATPPDKDNCRQVLLPTSSDHEDAFVARLSRIDGGLIWIKGFGGGGKDRGEAVTVAGDRAIAVGVFEGVAMVDGAQVADAGDGTGVFMLNLAASTGALGSAERLGRAGADQYVTITTDSRGDFLVGGDFDGLTTKNDEVGGARDVSILKYHPTADKPELQWSKRIKPDGDSSQVYGLALAADRAGSFFITGSFSGSLLLPGGRGGRADAALDVYVAKLSADGTPDWLQGSDDRGEDIGRSIALDRDGAIAVAGSFGDNMDLRSRLESAGRTDVFVAKIRPGAKTVSWSACIGSRGVDIGRGVAMGPAPDEDAAKPAAEKKGGQVVVVGSYTETVAFAGAYQLKRYSTVTEPNHGSSDGFVAWYGSDGQLLDHLVFGSVGDDAAAAVAIDDDNQTYVTGWFQDKITIGTVTLESHLGSVDGFLAKFDAKHKVVWAYRIGGGKRDKIRALAIDRVRGDVVVAGVYQDKLELQDASKDAKAVLDGAAAKGKEDHNRGFVALYQTSGALAWAKSYRDDDNDVAASAVALNELDHEVNEMNISTAVDHGAVAVAYHIGTDEDVKLGGLTWQGHGVVIRYTSKGEPEQRKAQRPMPEMCRDRVRALALSGNTLVASGAFSRTAYKVGKREVCVGPASDIFIVKFDHRKAVATRTFASEGDDDACGIARQTRDDVDDTGKHRRIDETVVTGNYQGVLKLDDKPHGVTLRSVDSADVFVLDLDL